MNKKNIILILFSIIGILSSNGERIIKTSFLSKAELDSIPIRVYGLIPIWTKSKLNVYINNKLYKKSIYPINDFLYLPDSLEPNDKIKVKILRDEIFKSKTYKFKYSHSHNKVIKIKLKHHIHLFQRKRRGCGGNFW